MLFSQQQSRIDEYQEELENLDGTRLDATPRREMVPVGRSAVLALATSNAKP
jgi:hypothetical protein